MFIRPALLYAQRMTNTTTSRVLLKERISCPVVLHSPMLVQMSPLVGVQLHGTVGPTFPMKAQTLHFRSMHEGSGPTRAFRTGQHDFA